MNTWYVIPARKDSKGIPFKNRKLFTYTADTIPKELSAQVIVSTDDDALIEQAKEYGFKTRKRSQELSHDTASMKDVLIDLKQHYQIDDNDIIVLLYLTYPQRTWGDIQEILTFFGNNNGTALSCCLDVADHPYLCFVEGAQHTGTPVVNHDSYRRQDYPRCFRLSLFVGIFKAFQLPALNNLLVCKETIFYKLSKKVIDIDNEIDMINFHQENGC